MTVGELVDRIPPGEVANVTYPLAMTDIAILALRQTVDLVEFGAQLGLEAVPHNRQGDLIWDVKQTKAAGGQPLTRSQTAKEFPLHTDASFERDPPRFFMLQVMHSDRFGGGSQKFVPLKGILENLDLETTQALRRETFTWKVPKEFQKDTAESHLPILFTGDEDDLSVRYREECISNRRYDRRFFLLRSFQTALWRAPYASHNPSQNEIILVDNWRLLHSRSEVRDPSRHLQRARFKA